MYRQLLVVALAGLMFGLADATLGADDPALVGWWKLNEGDGDTALDSSGRGVNGTINNLGGGLGLNGSVWVEDSERGTVLGFSGNDTTGAYVAAGGIPAMDLTNDFTWMVWCKQEQGGGGVNKTMLGNRYGGTAAPLQFVKFTPTKFEYYNDDATYANSITYPTPLPDNEWVHNAAVKKGAALTYYRNGKKVLSTTLTKTMDANPFYMGGDAQGERWRGYLSDVRLYERAVTEAEIYQIGAQLKARKPSPADGALNVGMPLLTWAAGETAIFHDVYLGADPNLTAANLVSPRQPVALYYHLAGFTPGTTYYWRVDEIEKDAVTTHTGDVWSFITQALTAYYPSPAEGSNTAAPAPTLTWLPGLGAVKHQVYFSDRFDDVNDRGADADKGVLALADTLLAPGTLDSLTTYYWRVDELGTGDVVKDGPIWSFTTILPIDDFESYTDEDGSRIYQTWLDGLADGSSGSTVGNIDAPFAEQVIVHDANQAMPIDYNNINAPFYSEAQRQFDTAQDWTAGGADTLVLFIRGRRVNNVAPLYVAIEDTSKRTAAASYPDEAILNATKWIEWKIPLADFSGVNLSRIQSIYIGVGDKAASTAGGAGRLYVDDIGLAKTAAAQ